MRPSPSVKGWNVSDIYSTVNIVALSSAAIFLLCRVTPQLEIRTGNPAPLEPLSSQGDAVIDVPGSHYCNSSEPSSGNFMDFFFSLFFALAFGIISES